MFWNKKDNEEQEKPVQPDPPFQGKAYKFKQIKFYALAETQYENKRPYRKIFEQQEITYLNWEVALFNRRFDDADWKATITTKCYRLDGTKKEMCNINEEINVTKDIDIFYYRYSWGTENPGYWTAGIYSWEVYINNELAGTDTMSIYNYGLVTEESNPYFDVQAIRFYPAYNDYRESRDGYRYVTQFDVKTTEYAGVELEVKIKIPDAFNYELKYNVIKENGVPKTSFINEASIAAGDAGRTEYIRYGWGTAQPGGFWKKNNYLIYVHFMDQRIASSMFSFGDGEISGTPSAINYQQNNQQAATNVSEPAKKKTTEELLAEMDELIGMENVKRSIRENIEYLQFNKIRMGKGFKDDSAMSLHSVFTGNPGTGKTTIVRLLAQIYSSMGLLSKGHVVEVGRAELIGEYIGQTAPKVKKAITNARGGVLFIDEAYALMRDENDAKDFGHEAIEIIIKEMSDGPGDIAIVVAGYPSEMQTFINANPGLKSRFKQYFHFDDYLPNELMQIAGIALKKEEATMTADAEKMLRNYITEQYRSRDKSFGNARLIYGIVDEAKKQMGIRLLKKGDVESLSHEELSTITADDLQALFAQNNRSKLALSIQEKELKDVMDELNELVGLQAIKKEITDTTSLVRFYSETGKDVLNKFSLHAILTGNPGTGKTTLARLLGKIYKSLGLLERGHVVEVDRQSLVAGYVGQTAIKTANVLNSAMGGVLFIDEAYALSSGSETDFGQEAIETILKTMEDKRGMFAVIAAGYPDNMDVFLRSNPGLKSRFDKIYSLPDYSPAEMMDIAALMLTHENLQLQDDAKNYLLQYFTGLSAQKDKYFGNARTVRQAIESIVTKQNLRLAAMPAAQRTTEMLQKVLMEDVNHLTIAQRQNSGIGFRREG